MVHRERVSVNISQTFVKWDVKNKEEKVSRSVVDQGSHTTDRTQAAMNQVTGRMLGAQIGRISWSLWNEKSFDEKDKLVWKPYTEQLRRWKVKVQYTYASLGEEVARHPIWLL